MNIFTEMNKLNKTFKVLDDSWNMNFSIDVESILVSGDYDKTLIPDILCKHILNMIRASRNYAQFYSR